jgi:hypothetical protein
MKRSRKEKIPLTSQKNSEAGQVSTILQCLWCNFKSEIAFDMENHLYEKHRYGILKKLQIESDNIEDKIQYSIDLIKQRSEAADDANDNNVR